ncbi:hypothetical protein ACIQYL_22080 [Lysinibacillus xylanilyticus]|uniref:ORC-CDC6 family AAA ATPase n=1 Tax=Lysinibacillus xylanilyticus TaxID=582475 RepID=UPI003815F6B4
MVNIFYRTEEIKNEEILNYFVESAQERQIIDKLKLSSPVILVGSRGVGKSFLFKVAQKEMLDSFDEKKVLPVYVTFRSSSLLVTNNKNKFHNWMLARICNEILRALKKKGLVDITNSSFTVLGDKGIGKVSNLEQIVELYENSWKDPNQEINAAEIPTIDAFLDAIEDICEDVGINRIVLFIDEAAHVFLPEQQRQFFNLFRDLRSPYVSCNAAVYPGVTVYGEFFQPTHDASLINLHRSINEEDYIGHMKDMVVKQLVASSDTTSEQISQLLKRGENFSILAYAASGNPRHLLKTIISSGKLENKQVNETIRAYYRTDIWAEHSNLAEKYKGHRELIDWGRNFIENEVLPSIVKKNAERLGEDKKTSSYFWVHRDAPQVVKEALRLLEYTGILFEEGKGIKATSKQVGSRYFLNIGILISNEAVSTSTALDIIRSISPRNSTEYGINSKNYESLKVDFKDLNEPDMPGVLNEILLKEIEVLDLPVWQIEELKNVCIFKIKDILLAKEEDFKKIYMVGDVRARRIKSAAVSSVYEYLSD